MAVGIDLGSRAVKLVEYDGAAITRRQAFDTAAFYRDFGRLKDGTLEVDFAGIGINPAGRLTVTGYGRNTIKVVGAKVVSEVKAHTVGAVRQSGLKDFTLLDIGGQDSKVMKVSGGAMEDFAMNDKCAASSGRYIENMAAILAMPLDELSRHFTNPVRLSATCAIFGESEIIQKVAEGVPAEEIAAGVNLTIVKRVLPMLARYPDGPVVFSGGVARNTAVARLIQETTGRKVVTLPEPTFNGALGCALLS
ncbi:MAG TPA: acyl-CoA dehydratase activase [Nitrospirota bacterium]